MNYVTHVLEALLKDVKNLEKKGFTENAATLTVVANLIIEAEKFLLPAGNHLEIEVKPDAFPFLRMPFPVMVLEYPIDQDHYKTHNLDPSIGAIHKSSKRVVLLIDSHAGKYSKLVGKLINPEESARGVYVISMFYLDDMKEWSYAQGVGFIPFDHAPEGTIIQADSNKTSRIPCQVAELFPGFTNAMVKSGMTTRENANKLLQNDLVEDMAVSLKALMCLSARNTAYVTLDAPHKLNKKRMKRADAIPYFEYKILDIFLTPGAKRIGKSNMTEVTSSLMRWVSDKARRLHKVMGHYKVRKSGIFWWNFHIRGDKAAGTIEKDYHVH